MSPEPLGVAFSGLLVVVALAISVIRKLEIEKELVVAAMRAALQLVLLGAVLGVLIADDSPVLFAWLWIAAMVVFTAATVSRRVREIPGVFWVAAVGALLGVVVCLAILLGFGVYEAKGRVIVPLAGIMMGNSLSTMVLCARRVADELREHRDEVEAKLALGMGVDQASARHIRHALKTAILPQIESTKAVGIVALPGAMTGLLLAGVDPMEAIRVQITVMYLVLGSISISASVVALGIGKRAFNAAEQLVI